MSLKTYFTLAVLAVAPLAFAESQTFDFKDAKGVNNAAFSCDAPLESLSGVATGISGKVTYDPANPDTVAGKLVVETKSMHVGNPMQQEHMLGSQWLDAPKYPEITFEAKGLKNAKKDGDSVSGEVTGTFTLKGIAKEMTIPVKITYLKDKLQARLPSMHGDLLVIRSEFSIKRSDFDINPGKFEDKVSNDIQLRLSIAGACPK